MLDQGDRKNVDDIKKISFTSTRGNIIELEEFADITLGNGFASLERKNRLNSTTIRCYVLGTAAGTLAQKINQYLTENPLNENVKMTWGGVVKRPNEGFGAMGTAM